jgi:phenylacetate-coenzyme A ligase PaaK-like adenylate-forming protein
LKDPDGNNITIAQPDDSSALTDTSVACDDLFVRARRDVVVDGHPLRLIVDAAVATRSGGEIERRQTVRFADAVARARAGSPFYRRLYAGLPVDVRRTDLPTTGKADLMADFDDWVTDRDVRLESLRSLVSDPARVGERYLGRYTVATTSGTTGEPGIFLLDQRTMHVTSAMAVRMLRSWLGPRDVMRILAKQGRTSMVMARGGHFASAVAAARIIKSPRRSKRLQVLSVAESMDALTEQLNRFDPAILAPYATVGAMLADEQAAGRLRIHPALVTLSAEGLPLGEYGRIASALDTNVGNSYAATECTFLSYSCAEDWLHLNADWVVIEPVDSIGGPVPPGEQSHSVLISNLANRVQPILRYDLGDSVVERPDRCPCGNRLPAIRVQGRAADIVTVTAGKGKNVSIPPLAFTLAVEQTNAVERHQIVQTSPSTFIVRLQPHTERTPGEAWELVRSALQELFERRGVPEVSFQFDQTSPQPSAGGKFRSVTPFRPSTD